MPGRRLLWIGGIGTAVTAICCFTPALVLLLAGLGLAHWTGWLDAVLLPALALFLVLTGVGLWRRMTKTSS